MDFYRAQDEARRRTRWLAVLFTLSLISLLAMSNGLLYLLFRYAESTAPAAGSSYPPDNPFMYVLVSALIVVIVGLSSLFKSLSLRTGGKAVAEMLNARLLLTASNPAEQRLLNVVEEMAIASGMPVPPVYIMEEEAINAFAAGHSTANAVVGVTRGAIVKLNRDELQGVIAHEFSHILHGDMKLNMRLIGWLYGIMVLGIIGQYLVRAAAVSRRNNNNNAVLAMMGLGLLILGASGSFFGSLIKAAVSRQREYLADASAVQYTRNPKGIANALKRIAADTAAPWLHNPAASQISHALFSEGVHASLNDLFATHPPLEKRIRALDPQWQPGQELEPRPVQPEVKQSSAATPKMDAAAAVTMALARVGAPDETDIRRARNLLESLPASCVLAAKDPQGAAALVSAVLLYVNQIKLPGSSFGSLLVEIQRVGPSVTRLDAEQRLLLLNLCLPSLRQLSLRQYQQLRAVWEQIAKATQNLSGWLLYELTISHLDRYFELSRESTVSRSLAQMQSELSVFFSMLAERGSSNPADADKAFAAARNSSGFEKIERIDTSAMNLESFQQACSALRSLKPSEQKLLMAAITACIYSDNTVTVHEHEIMRAVCEILGCPLPADIH
ncbi:MAG TPA: M48 family metallopeptidase [Pseudohongiella sp.]|nr:M48 family metallopeptidase [Pseudohongiella sp.]